MTPTKQDVLEFFGSSHEAASFLGITRQGFEKWPEGSLDLKRIRLLHGSFSVQGKRVPDQFKVVPVAKAAKQA